MESYLYFDLAYCIIPCLRFILYPLKNLVRCSNRYGFATVYVYRLQRKNVYHWKQLRALSYDEHFWWKNDNI